ncbi:MAG TPA: hypothetical protein VNI20_11310 [Fimbriimonadaceae bacterium]|nr:hypothetical protein [Fimbriimonadaceae bacterium]
MNLQTKWKVLLVALLVMMFGLTMALHANVTGLWLRASVAAVGGAIFGLVLSIVVRSGKTA